MASSPLSSFETTSQPHLAPFLSLKNIHFLHIDLSSEPEIRTRVSFDRLPHREPLELEELRRTVRRQVVLPLHLFNPTSCILIGTSSSSTTSLSDDDGREKTTVLVWPRLGKLDLLHIALALGWGSDYSRCLHNPLHQ
ncbi:hypothetical protein BDY24DRAFT_412373 [Mrakia frigida]|uniref:uncharacterized protein n=1 Tax=Mrakia frigida TaxID=29902 RepID=UPI003FCC2249